MTEQTFNVHDIGTIVFIPHVKRKEVEAACPDCYGEKKWIIRIPSQENARIIDCPRCKGGEHPWLIPKKYEFEVAVTEAKITKFEIDQEPCWSDPGVIKTRITYGTAPYQGTVTDKNCFLTREEAEAAGEIKKAEDIAKEHKSYREERERVERRAGQDIIEALRAHANRHHKELQEKIKKLKEEMMEAIRHPSLYGPSLKNQLTKYGTPELTSENLASWLGELLDKADIEGWSEDELHEAMCHC